MWGRKENMKWLSGNCIEHWQHSAARFDPWWLLYSEKLSREKTFANSMVLWLFALQNFGVWASFGTAKASNPRKSYFSLIHKSFLPQNFSTIRYFKMSGGVGIYTCYVLPIVQHLSAYINFTLIHSSLLCADIESDMEGDVCLQECELAHCLSGYLLFVIFFSGTQRDQNVHVCCVIGTDHKCLVGNCLFAEGNLSSEVMRAD